MMRFKEGDQDAFRLLFDKYKKRIISYCYRYCGHRETAEELAQETFLRVHKASRRYRPKARFSTWLFRIATNVCLNEIRKPHYSAKLESMDQPLDGPSGKTLQLPREANESMPDAQLESRQNQVQIQQAMGRIPEEQRVALLLRATEEFSYQEIGRQLNRSENQVKTLIFRARRHLKKILGVS